MAGFAGLLRNQVTVCLFRQPFSKHRGTISLASGAPRQEYKSLDALPGPKKAPIIGSGLRVLWQSRKQPQEKLFLENQLLDVDKYGRIFKLKSRGVDTVQIADPDVPKRFDSPVIEHYRAKGQTSPGGFFANGPEWWEYRNAINKKAVRPREVAEYAPVLNEISSEFLDRVNALRGPVGTEFENEVAELDNELINWSFESVAHVLFHRRFGCVRGKGNQDTHMFITSMRGLVDSLMDLTFMPVWLYKLYQTDTHRELTYHFATMYRYADLFIGKTIQEFKRQGNCEDENADYFRFLLSRGKLAEGDIVASVIDLLFTGVNTTSNTTLWALYMMGDNPDKQFQLHKHVTSVLGPHHTPTADIIAKIPYLRAWLKETLRLYPVLSTLPRILPQDTDLLGFSIPAGTNVNILTYYMGRDESVFQDADQFKPERWLQHDSIAEEIHEFASISFGMGLGMGSRMCEVRRIAELQLRLLIAKTVQRFIVSYPHKDEVQPRMRVFTTPDRPIRVKFSDRPIK